VKHFWGDTVLGLGVSFGTFLEQEVYHLRDAMLVCEVKRGLTFVISSADVCSFFNEKSENVWRIALCSKV
jgi:hypothetical protein